MSRPTVTTIISPTGGAIILNIALGSASLDINNTNITIQRYIGSLSATPTQIYTGNFTPVYIDVGDNLPNFLDFTTAYYYKVTDPTGSTTVGPIIPASQLAMFSNYLDGVLFRLFSAGISAVAVPQGFNKIRVLEAMPLSMGSDGSIFPFVVMNLDLEQQESLQIGEGVLASITNLNIIPLNILRRYSINILSLNARERDFYKDACKAVAYTMMTTMDQMGQDFTYDLQAANTQVSDNQMLPGFYASVISFEFVGQFNMSITTTYPPISFINPSITSTVSGSSGITWTFEL